MIDSIIIAVQKGLPLPVQEMKMSIHSFDLLSTSDEETITQDFLVILQ